MVIGRGHYPNVNYAPAKEQKHGLVSSTGIVMWFRSMCQGSCCFKSVCPPPDVPNGSSTLSRYSAEITCNKYYYLTGSTSLNCVTGKNDKMRWDQAAPTCTRHTCSTWPCVEDEFCVDTGKYLYCHPVCPDLGTVEHGTIKSFQTYANLTCDEFYYATHYHKEEIRGKSWASIACQSDGTWDLPEEPRCAPHTCDTFKCEQTVEAMDYKKLNRTFCYVSSAGFPTCGYGCLEPSPKPHIVQKLSIYSYPSNASFWCDSGYYYLQGHPLVECRVHGEGSWHTPPGDLVRPNEFRCIAHTCYTWTNCLGDQWCEMILDTPTCKGPCSTPLLTDGIVTINKQIATFECNQYYYLEGSNTITCNSNLEWEEEFPACVQHTCETWTCPDDTYCVLQDDSFSCWPVPHATVQYGPSYSQYACESEQYNMEGVSTLKCSKEGSWNSDPPSCVPHDCASWDCEVDQYCLTGQDGMPACFPGCPSLTPDSIPSPTHTFSCDQHHYIDGPETLNCKPNGEWEGEPPQCLPHTCDTWPCLDTQFCLDIESALSVPTCYTSCEEYEMFKNGRFVSTKNTMTFVCNEYYIVKGKSMLTCQDNGEWNAPKPTCEPRTCDTWKCDEEQYCEMTDGKPTCYPKCPKLSDIQNGKVEQTPATATYTCVSDMFYIPNDENRQWCLKDGVWSGFPPECVPQGCATYICGLDQYCKIDDTYSFIDCYPACPDLGSVKDGTVIQRDESAIIFCDKNFYLYGTETLLCQNDGSWNDVLPVCLVHVCQTISCNEDQICVNTVDGFPVCTQACPSFDITDERLQVNVMDAQAVFSCDLTDDYFLWGHSTLNCLPSGEWDNDPPTCEKSYVFREGHQECLDLICGQHEYCNGFEEIKKCHPRCAKITQADYNEGEVAPKVTYRFYQNGIRTEHLVAYISCPSHSYLSHTNELVEVAKLWLRRVCVAISPPCHVVTCMPDGNWNDLSPPHCIPHDCSTWEEPCADGEMCEMVNGKPACVLGDCSAITCADDEFCYMDFLSGNIPVCKKACPDLENPVFGAVEKSNTVAKFTCQSSHYLVGAYKLRCEEGIWDNSAPTCEAYTCEEWECDSVNEYCIVFQGIPVCQQACPLLAQPTNGAVEQTYTSATFYCDKFYRMEGSSLLSCQSNGHWDRAAPTCKPHDCSSWVCSVDEYCLLSDKNSLPSCFKSCPKLSDTQLKSVAQTDTTATFQCLSIYRYLKGLSTLLCSTAGVWDGDAPTCIKHTCKTWNCGNPPVGETGHLCEWDADIPGPTCYLKSPVLVAPDHGNVNVKSRLTVFDCDSKYILEGEKTLSYNHITEKWSAPPPTCIPRTCAEWVCSETEYCSIINNLPSCKTSCPALPSLSNGDLSVVGGTAMFSCQDDHYFLEGSEKLDCVEGEWEGEAPTCTVHTCDTFLCEETEYCEVQDNIPTCLPRCEELELENGTATMHKGAATFHCNQYFYMSGESRITCSNSAWTGSEPECVPHTCNTYPCGAEEFCELQGDITTCYQGCQEVLLLENGTVEHTKKRAKFQCDEYFYLEGVNSVTCKGGSWSGDLPKCVPHDCASWSCGSDMFCLMEHDTPTCHLACPVLDTLDNGSVVQHSTTARYTCDSLYRRVGRNVLHCVEGEWDGTPPLCVFRTCEFYSCPSGMYCEEVDGVPACFKECTTPTVYSGNVTRTTSSAQITCLEGFQMNGAGTVHCSNGDWDPEPPSCIPTKCELLETCQENHSCRLITGIAICSPDCPTLDIPNGQVSISNFVASLSCKPGYKMRGVSTALVCRLDGSWGASPPLCIEPRWDYHKEQLGVCLADLRYVSSCDDVIEEFKEEVEDDVMSLDFLLGVMNETEYSSTRHSFLVSKLLLQEMQPLEDRFTDKIRDYVKDIAVKNVDFMFSFEDGEIKPGIVRKIVAMTMRLLNSIIRSVQRDLNSKRTDFDKDHWRKRGRSNEGPDLDIFSREPNSVLMKSLKEVGEHLVGILVSKN
ncbi:sushi, von Willebrand factor type A, EGF and pentraxin domain-containing protein 1-like isoform X2 [Bolinopsis microptera]|uniref:sushi, von Willebrand factor type A, EGF and pentraxin domain-containing protein 1-like isoform X2 n=1 Tax=Bolinopsis microptera TaxID=2820187 RepID=UPI003079C701